MPDTKIKKKLIESIELIQFHSNLKPCIGLILGSGLGGFADKLKEKVKIPTSQVPHYPESTVRGHKGFLVFGKLQDIPVLAVQGRTHYYEGHNIQDVTYVVRIMSELGIRLLLVTNAAGGVNPQFSPGDLMIIVDHINFMFRNPLRGPTVGKEPRWPDMYDTYDKEYSDLIEQVGLDLKIPLRKGVLFVSTGPTYETASEVQMARILGGDAVSMSTVPEVLIARANGIKVVGISCITNMATGIGRSPLSHDEVTEIAKLGQGNFQKLIRGVILKLGKLELHK